MAATPLMTFIGAGYYIIVLFLFMGIIGIIRAVRDKHCDKVKGRLLKEDGLKRVF